jgi:hypothetical protein
LFAIAATACRMFASSSNVAVTPRMVTSVDGSDVSSVVMAQSFWRVTDSVEGRGLKKFIDHDSK